MVGCHRSQTNWWEEPQDSLVSWVFGLPFQNELQDLKDESLGTAPCTTYNEKSILYKGRFLTFIRKIVLSLFYGNCKAQPSRRLQTLEAHHRDEGFLGPQNICGRVCFATLQVLFANCKDTNLFEVLSTSYHVLFTWPFFGSRL